MDTWVIAGYLAVVGIVAFGASAFRGRTNLKRELQSLQREHRELKSMLHGFMEESGKIVTELSRIVTADRPKSTDTSAEDCDKTGGPDQPKAKPRHGIDRKHHVLSLARKGSSASDIAGQLMMPQGEVQLIMDLYRDRLEESQTAGFAQAENTAAGSARSVVTARS
jgi:hypothetical protein